MVRHDDLCRGTRSVRQSTDNCRVPFSLVFTKAHWTNGATNRAFVPKTADNVFSVPEYLIAISLIYTPRGRITRSSTPCNCVGTSKAGMYSFSIAFRNSAGNGSFVLVPSLTPGSATGCPFAKQRSNSTSSQFSRNMLGGPPFKSDSLPLLVARSDLHADRLFSWQYTGLLPKSIWFQYH